MAGAAADTRWGWKAPPPRLGRASFLAFKALWFALLALAVVAPLAGAWLRADWVEQVTMPFERAGLATNLSSGRIRLDRPYSDEATRSGIAAGDRIIAVGGRAVPDDLASRPAIAALLRGPEGSTVRIRTRSAAGVERDHVLTRAQANSDRDYVAAGLSYETYQVVQLALGSLPAFCLIGAAVLLFRRRSRDLVPALFSLSFLLLSATLINTRYFYQGLGLFRAQDVLGLVGGDLFILALLLFPNGRFAQRWAPFVALLLIPASLADYFYLWPYEVSSWCWYALLVAPLASLLLRYRRLPVGAERQQIRWALFGFAAGIGAFGIISLIETLNTNSQWDPARIWLPLGTLALGVLAQICLAAGLLVSLLKYRLYDADAVISRSAGYAVLTLMLGATFAGTAKGMEVFFETNFRGEAGAWPGVIGAGLAVALITPLHNRVHAWTERRFQKGLLHMRRDLPLCVGDLRETAGIDELLAQIVDRITRGVRASRVAVLLNGKLAGGSLDGAVPHLPDGASEPIVAPNDPVFPLRIPLRSGHGAQDAPIGWLLLGPRPDGSLYGKDELDALREIAEPIERAVRIVQLRETRERETGARAARQNRRIATLEKAVAALTARPGAASA
jgi:hypothetical protein